MFLYYEISQSSNYSKGVSNLLTLEENLEILSNHFSYEESNDEETVSSFSGLEFFKYINKLLERDLNLDFEEYEFRIESYFKDKNELLICGYCVSEDNRLLFYEDVPYITFIESVEKLGISMVKIFIDIHKIELTWEFLEDGD